MTAIERADAVVICPSNPWVSIDPILGIAGIRAGLRPKVVVAVSPIIAGETIKGPAAKMYRELGIEPSALAVADHYRGLLRGFVMDNRDAALRNSIEGTGVQTLATNTIMQTTTDRVHLAQDVLHFVGKLK
jgi:LPPG:FO 2-phospho-L-lactate transferase